MNSNILFGLLFLAAGALNLLIGSDLYAIGAIVCSQIWFAKEK